MAYQFIDILKSSESHNKWEEVTSLLTSYSRNQNEIVNSISQSLLHLNNYSSKFRKPVSRNDKEKSFKYIKLLCKLKHLLYSETSRNGLNCLELSCDWFRIILVLNDNRTIQNDSSYWIFKQILFEYNKDKPVGCPELLKSLADGCYDQLLVHIYELQMLFSVGHDRQEQGKAFLCLQSLEEDINKLSKCPINMNNASSDFAPFIPQPSNLIGIVKIRSGGIPAQFVFYCPTGTKPDADQFAARYKITLQLMNHHEKNQLPFIPLVNLQKDANGNCIPSFVNADTVKCVPLAAKFVLKLSHSLVMSDVNIAAILSITGLDVMTSGVRMNYIDLILMQNGSSLISKDQFFSILPNDNQLVFQIVDEEICVNAQSVACVPFLLPSQLPRIVAILKKQAVINGLMESFLSTDLNTSFIKDGRNAQPIDVSIISHDSFLFSYTRRNSNGKHIKFSVTFNELCQVQVKFRNSITPDTDCLNLSKFQQVVQKYNNLPMSIFWLLYKSGDIFAMESYSGEGDCNSNSNQADCPSTLMDNSNRFIEDSQFVNDCIAVAKSNLNISSIYSKDILPKIKIEPKIELMTTSCPPINSSPSTILLHDSIASIGKSKPPLSHNQEYQNSSMMQMSNQPDGNNQPLIPINAIPNMNSAMTPQNQSHKSEPMPPYSNYGLKHLSLDQMLSSDFAMPFTSDALGSLNTLSHSMHYSDHPSHTAAIPSTNNTYSSHFNMMPHQKDVNPKIARMYDSQSSVLVNLLNCNENPGSNNSSGGFVNRQMSRNISNPSPMSDQFDSPLMHPHMSRMPQMPRLRMPHPNPPKSAVTSPRPPVPMISSSPPSKTDVMMMPYPQDTGNGRAVMSRKPRKRKISTLEMNQRLPKQPMMQPPTIRQPIHHEGIHSSIPLTSHPVQHTTNPIQQHQPPSISSSNFSSPTTMDQSIYDFDDNTDCGRSRHMSSAGNMQSQPNNFNNPANRKPANAASKKPLKVKISRKAISQNPGSQEFKPSSNNPDHDSKLKEKMSRSNSIPVFNPNINAIRSTAIMNAIDSPLTCSSLSSMQTSPHGSLSVSCSQMSGSIESINDPSLLKKRRKRRLKSELEDAAESLKKKEKLEIRKQNRKKKELLLAGGNSQSGISSNSSLETVPSTDMTIKAPLPIKLSLNAKTGSVSTNNSQANIGNVRAPKVTLPLSSQPSNPNGSWMNQNPALQKPSKAELKHQSGSIAEPLLKNYKIPKKKSSDSQMSVPLYDPGKSIMQSNQQFSKTHQLIPQSDAQKPTKEPTEFVKSEPELSSNNTITERPKTPIMLHPDAAVSLSSQMQIPSTISEQDFKLNPDLLSSSTTPLKAKKINDIADKLRARTGSTSGNTPDPVGCVSTSAIANAISDMSTAKPVNSSLSLDNSQTSSENIFEKFSSSKNNGKSDHRQFTNSRFPDPSCMYAQNMQRYPYNRPPAGFPATKLRPPVGAPLPFGMPRQPYLNSNTINNNNAGVFRMDSAPIRNFSPVNPANIPYGPKKNSTTFANKKK